jgi:hypothetical protein
VFSLKWKLKEAMSPSMASLYTHTVFFFSLLFFSFVRIRNLKDVFHEDIHLFGQSIQIITSDRQHCRIGEGG